MLFTYQLQNTAPQMVQKQFVVNNHTHTHTNDTHTYTHTHTDTHINFLVSNVYIYM